LSGIGRRDDALTPTQEAVTIYRALAENNPAAYLPDLAMSLNNLGNRLSDIGRHDDALAVWPNAIAAMSAGPTQARLMAMSATSDFAAEEPATILRRAAELLSPDIDERGHVVARRAVRELIRSSAVDLDGFPSWVTQDLST
jgi:tetratricopeptide (TPR) repeat protein